MLFEKNPADEKIFLLQNETVISDDTKQIYNDYFCNITDTFDISSWNTSEILKKIFSLFLCVVRSGHSTQHEILNLFLKWQKCLDEKGIVGTVLYGPF